MSHVLEELEVLLRNWQANAPRQLETMAFLRDSEALLELSPAGTSVASLPLGTACAALLTLHDEMRSFLTLKVLPTLRRLQKAKRPSVVSPYAGGVPMDTVSRTRTGEQLKQTVKSHLNVAVLNPGKTGFLTLATHEVLDWRIVEIDEELSARGVDVCALPGARCPAGLQLPPDFPYFWVGEQTSSWAGTGFFIKVELESSVRVMSYLGNPRIIWIEI